MSSVGRFLLWFLLVPYFAVRSLNVRPWIGEDRESANRTNAQGAVGLIIAFIVMGILGMIGKEPLPNHPYLFAIAAVVPPMVITGVLLNRQREQAYWSAYKCLPLWKRGAFGIGTLILVAVTLRQAPSHPAPDHPRSQKLTCNSAASEVSAETCSVE